MFNNVRQDGNGLRHNHPKRLDVRMAAEKPLRLIIVTALATLPCACVVVPPNQPTVLALPGSGKNFEQFNADNNDCKQYASAQVNGQTPESVAAESGARTAAVGTILGAAAGAAINGGQGAAAGAGTGLVFGGLAGTGTANASMSLLQQRYDFGYVQCMYAKGHRVPVAGGNLMNDSFYGHRGRYIAPPPPAAAAPSTQ